MPRSDPPTIPRPPEMRNTHRARVRLSKEYDEGTLLGGGGIYDGWVCFSFLPHEPQESACVLFLPDMHKHWLLLSPSAYLAVEFAEVRGDV